MEKNLLQSYKKKKDLQYEKGQEKMSHHCGCSAFIIHLVCLIIDQHNA